MRLGLWVVLLSGCSGGYPLEPTPCDELCHATQGRECPSNYEPASCVAECELADLYAPECRSFFDRVITCYRDNPGAAAQRCDYFTPYEQRDCQADQDALGLCIQRLKYPDYFGEPLP